MRACKRKTRAKDQNARNLFRSARNSFRKRGKMHSLQKQSDSERKSARNSFCKKERMHSMGEKKKKQGKREKGRAQVISQERKNEFIG